MNGMFSEYPRETRDSDLDLCEGEHFLHKPFQPTVLACLMRQMLETAPK